MANHFPNASSLFGCRGGRLFSYVITRTLLFHGFGIRKGDFRGKFRSNVGHRSLCRLERCTPTDGELFLKTRRDPCNDRQVEQKGRGFYATSLHLPYSMRKWAYWRQSPWNGP